MTVKIDEVLIRASEELEAGRRVALCLLARTQGSTPAPAGSLMVVTEQASMIGTIGGGCVEAEVRRAALGLLSAGRSALLSFQLNHDYGWDDGLICGGSIEVAIALPRSSADVRAAADAHRERRGFQLTLQVGEEHTKYVLELPPRPRLLIAGAGHVGGALAALATSLDFEVTVFDDRPDLVERIRGNGVSGVSGSIDEQIQAYGIDDETYIVIVTRGHRHDEQVLAAVLESRAKYIGMIGSRRKVKLTFDDLRTAGHSEDALARVHAPIGIPIHSVTVQEIALSIAAELVSVRRAEFRSPVRALNTNK